MATASQSVLIGDATAHVTLVSLSPDEPWGFADVAFREPAFGLEGTISAITLWPEPFVLAIEEMDRSLFGEAELETSGRCLKLRLKIDERGRVTADVGISSNKPFADLKYRFEMDQTYLAPIARDLRRAFLAH